MAEVTPCEGCGRPINLLVEDVYKQKHECYCQQCNKKFPIWHQRRADIWRASDKLKARLSVEEKAKIFGVWNAETGEVEKIEAKIEPNKSVEVSEPKKKPGRPPGKLKTNKAKIDLATGEKKLTSNVVEVIHEGEPGAADTDLSEIGHVGDDTYEVKE